MKYRIPLTPEQARLRQSMPVNPEGFIVSLFHTPAKRLEAAEGEWRAWAREHPRAEWPDWLGDWADQKQHTSVSL